MPRNVGEYGRIILNHWAQKNWPNVPREKIGKPTAVINAIHSHL
jgi:hypothetical protein